MVFLAAAQPRCITELVQHINTHSQHFFWAVCDSVIPKKKHSLQCLFILQREKTSGCVRRWAISLDLEKGGGFISCLLGGMSTVFVSLQQKAGQNICIRENTAWKENGTPLHCNLCEVSANLVYPIFWQAKSLNQLFSASFLFTSAAHNNSYQLIISVLWDKILFDVTKIKWKQNMSNLSQIHCHCSGRASQQIFEHLKSVLSAEQDLNWAAFHLKNHHNNNPAKMFLAFSAQEEQV